MHSASGPTIPLKWRHEIAFAHSSQSTLNNLAIPAKDLHAQSLEDLAGDELVAHSEGMVPNGLARVDGKTYGLAYTFSTPVMFINADLFRAAGLDPDQPPRTWAEVKAAGIAIRETTGKHGFFPGAFGPIDGTFVYQSLVMSNGGKVREGNKLTYAEPAAAEAVTMLRDLRDSGAYADIDVAAHMDTFASGDLGMFLFTSAIQSRMQKAAEGNFELRVAAMPSFGDKPTAPTNSGSALFVQANPMIKPNLEQLTRLTPNVAFPGPNYRQVESMMKDAAAEAVLGKSDPIEVLNAAQERGQALMPADG